MSPFQRQILVATCQTSDFPIVTVEYPAGVTGHGNENLKIVTIVEGELQVDYYDRGGRTVSQFVAREAR